MIIAYFPGVGLFLQYCQFVSFFLNNVYLRDFINHLSIGPRPVIFGQDQLISVADDPVDQLIFMFIAKR